MEPGRKRGCGGAAWSRTRIKTTKGEGKRKGNIETFLTLILGQKDEEGE